MIKEKCLEALELAVLIILWLPFLVLKKIVDGIFNFMDELTNKIQILLNNI